MVTQPGFWLGHVDSPEFYITGSCSPRSICSYVCTHVISLVATKLSHAHTHTHCAINTASNLPSVVLLLLSSNLSKCDVSQGDLSKFFKYRSSLKVSFQSVRSLTISFSLMVIPQSVMCQSGRSLILDYSWSLKVSCQSG